MVWGFCRDCEAVVIHPENTSETLKKIALTLDRKRSKLKLRFRILRCL